MEIIGFHIDLKAQMPSFSYLLRIIDSIADMGYNTVLLEYQDKFPYSGELAPLASPDALTAEEIAELKELCKKRGIEIIPMMQCLGHMYWVTRFDRYAGLGEHFSEKGNGSHSLCASKAEAFELFKKLASQVMALHSDSKYFHIGADEVKFSDSCPLCSAKPKAEILAGHYSKALGFVRERGYIPVMWGDMVVKHEGLADMLPRDTVIMDWDYTGGLSEDNAKDFYGNAVPLEKTAAAAFESTAKLTAKGFKVICAPAVRSMGDTVFMPRNIHFDNCIQSVYTAKSCGACGVIVTSWAVRRVPHVLTEPILALVPRLTGSEGLGFDAALSFIAEKYLGSKDTRAAEIPFEFAKVLNKAIGAAELLSSGQDFMDAETGHFLSESLSKRLGGTVLYRNQEVKSAYSELYKKCIELLGRIPDTEYSEYTRVLAWSIGFAKTVAELISGICDNAENREWLESRLSEFEKIQLPYAGFRDYYTEYSIITEYMARIGVYTDYLRMLLSSGKCAD